MTCLVGNCRVVLPISFVDQIPHTKIQLPTIVFSTHSASNTELLKIKWFVISVFNVRYAFFMYWRVKFIKSQGFLPVFVTGEVMP